MRDFFGSPDALHAAFWTKQQQQQAGQQQQQPAVQDSHTGTNNNATAGTGGSSSSPGRSSQGRTSQAANNSSSSLTQQQQQQPSRPQQQQQQPLWLQIDHAAVEELHSKLLSCRDDAVKDACCGACEKLLVFIATSAKQGRPNPRVLFRQVRQGGYMFCRAWSCCVWHTGV